jgi:hypothetical protein
MIDLAAPEHRPVALAAISQRQQISLSYLEQLFGKLRRHELVESTRGPGGGYTLGRKAETSPWPTSSSPWTSPSMPPAAAARKTAWARTRPLHDPRAVGQPERQDGRVPGFRHLRKLVDEQLAKGFESRRRRSARHLQPAGGQAHPRDGAELGVRAGWRVQLKKNSKKQSFHGHDPHFPIYLDYGATPVDPRGGRHDSLAGHFGNPASRSHAWGWEAEEAVEKARAQVADLIGADPREIVWTSGATESNNLALKGAAQFYKARAST